MIADYRVVGIILETVLYNFRKLYHCDGASSRKLRKWYIVFYVGNLYAFFCYAISRAVSGLSPGLTTVSWRILLSVSALAASVS